MNKINLYKVCCFGKNFYVNAQSYYFAMAPILLQILDEGYIDSINTVKNAIYKKTKAIFEICYNSIEQENQFFKIVVIKIS